MSKQPLNLLFKNAFRVFGKTKLLASELTLLMLVSTTVLTTTSLTNVNLDNSKQLIEKNSNPMEFSINEKEDESIDVVIQKLENSNLATPKYLHYLNVNNNFSPINGEYGGSNQNLDWMQGSANNNLAYYFVTKPTADGKNLLKLGSNQSSFASIILSPYENYQSLLNHTAEIFSFIQNPDNNLKAIPNADGTLQNNFDMRQILYDTTNKVAAGISKFGYAQVLGFDLNKKISMYHNIVDTKNSNQFIVQSYKNANGAYAVPNEILIYLGKQDEKIRQFYLNTSNKFWNDSWDFSSFANIFSDIGNNLNELGRLTTMGAEPQQEWIPYHFSIDFSENSTKTKFLKNILTDQSSTYQNLRDQINKQKYFDFKISSLTKNEIKNISPIYNSNDIDKIKTLRYLETIAWFPPYLTDSQLKESINETKNLWSNEINNFVNELINPIAPWNNVESDITKLLTLISQKVEIEFDNLNAQKLFDIGKDVIEKTQFNIINSAEFIKYYLKNQTLFNKIFDSKLFITTNDYVQALREYLEKCLDQYLDTNQTVKYFYDKNYTLNGILKKLDFEYIREKNFSISDSSSGNSYIISESKNNQSLNEIVDSNGNILSTLPNSNDESFFIAAQEVSFLSSLYWDETNAPPTEPDKVLIPSYDGVYENSIYDFIKKNTFKFNSHNLPKYELFVNFNLLDLFKKMYSDVEWAASPSQVINTLKCLYPFTKIYSSQINESFYQTDIIPLICDVFNQLIFNSISMTESAININAYYLLDIANSRTPIVGNMVSKSSYAAIVSTDFLTNNKYDAKNNPNGKEIYPDLNAFQNASRLPYLSIEDSTNNKENWFLNPLTGNVEYYNDFNDWFNKVPERYKITINGIGFLITDSGTSANFLYPVVSEQTLLVNSKKTAVLYMNNAGYSRALINSNGSIQNKYLSLRYIGNNKFSNWYHKNENYKKLKKWINENISTNSYYQVYKVNDSHQPNKLLYTRMTFIDNFQGAIIGITMTISLIVLILSLIFICTLIRSIIKQNRQMFGICLANGINKHALAISFIPFSLIPAIIAGVFGYIFGYLLQPVLNGMINQYWTLPILNIGWLWWLFILIPLFIFLLLFLISYIVVVWTLRKSATEILATPSTFRMNVLVENSNWLFKHFKARTAFKFTYIFGNITRFFILTAIVTSFITLCSITVGSINAFDTALTYTQRNKNYNFAFDLYSPTIQGGFYDIKPAALAGTSDDLQESLYQSNLSETSFAVPEDCQSYKINKQIFSTQKTFSTWLQVHSIGSQGPINSQDFNEFTFSPEITQKWISPADENAKLPENSEFVAQIKQLNQSNVFLAKPIKLIQNNNVIKTFDDMEPMQMVYQYLIPTYNREIYQDYWTNPYKVNGLTTYFDTIFYPSFNIVPNIQQDITFFSGKTWVKTLLDFDINLGAISLNPWMFAKTLMPSGIIALSEQRNKILLDRAIKFYEYLDAVEKGLVVDKEINYKNYYSAMDLNNKPYQNNSNGSSFAYNPINIDGSPLLDANNKVNFDKNKVLLIPKEEINNKGDIDYILNVNVASKGLPTFELFPETIRMWTYISTNFINPIYKKWETNILKVKNENFNYALGTNTVLVNDFDKSFDTEYMYENTYTYLNSTIRYENDKPARNDNIKIMGINPLPKDKNQEPAVALYDSKNSDNKNTLLNSLLLEKQDNYYPLIINEVVNQYYKFDIGDILDVDITNGLFRFKRYGMNENPNVSAKFKIVGITSSKSEMQFYTNQKFANEILGYTSSEDNANTLYPKNVTPFNGIFTKSMDPSLILNIAPVYAPLGINPAFSLCVKTKTVARDDNQSAILFAWNQLNNIFKFDLISNFSSNRKGLLNVINRIIDIGNMNDFATSYNCITSEIIGVDAKIANEIISGTIDETVSNIELIAIVSLLPTLFIIITLMATMIVTESRRLIAIMKVLGFGDWFNTFNFMFVYIIVLLFGLLLSIPLTYGLLAGFKALGFGVFSIIINPVAPWWIYFASSGVTAILFVILFIVVKFKMKKINLSQATSFN